MKVCKTCKIEKPLSEYCSNGGKYYRGDCKECGRKKSLLRYHALTPEQKTKRRLLNHDPDWHKEYKLKKLYGITRKEFDDMYHSQDGKCYICHIDIVGKAVKVDHNHSTGKVRKLLCHNCNTSLGLLKDSPELFNKCANYLKEHSDNF